MRRVMSFLLGFLIGGMISALIVWLVLPGSAKTLHTVYQTAYRKRKTELLEQFDL